jgi:hypothetical protein
LFFPYSRRSDHRPFIRRGPRPNGSAKHKLLATDPSPIGLVATICVAASPNGSFTQ